MNAVGADVGEITGRVAGLLVARICKAAGVEVRLIAEGGAVNTDAGEHLAAGNVGALIAVGDAGIGHADWHGLAGLKGKGSGALPAAGDDIENSIHVAADETTATEGKLCNNSSDETVGRVVGADRPLGTEIV